jgi:hypothetical protein
MGLGFLAPLFFAGLAALAIPLLVHLTHKERKEPVVFPSLMFLQKIPFRTQRRQRLRHWLLFLLRAAALTLLVFAFARPFFARQHAVAPRGGNVVLLIDRSASMGARGRWARAIAAARAEAARLEAGGKLALVAFDHDAEGITALTAEKAQAEAALGALRPGSGAGRYTPGLQAAGALLERENAGGEVVLISDFQRAGWDGSGASRLPPGVKLRTIDVGDTTLTNVGLTGIVLERQAGDEPKTAITARLAASRGAARDVPVTLLVESRAIQTVTVRVAPGTAAVAHFGALRDPEVTRRAAVAIPADDQPADDTTSFLLGPAPRLGVLVVTRGDAPARDLLYLREALGTARDPSLPVTVRAGGGVRAGDLAAASVVVLHDVPFPEGGAGRALGEWIQAGGGLVVALGSRGTLPRGVADSLGGAGAVVDRGDLGASLALSDASHPVFAGWGDRSDLGASRAFRYRRLERARTALARYDDGAPALAESRMGSGRVLVWTADFGNRWSDVPLHGAFVPLVHGLVKYAAGFEAPAPSRVVGDVVELARGERGEGREEGPPRRVIVQAPDGTRRELRAEESGLVLRDRGFYTIERGGQRASAMQVAANVPTSESDPARVVPEQLAAAVAPVQAAGVSGADNVETPVERERGQRVWWYLLAVVILLLAAESAVAHRAQGTR